jgi:hypothetical protein
MLYMRDVSRTRCSEHEATQLSRRASKGSRAVVAAAAAAAVVVVGVEAGATGA